MKIKIYADVYNISKRLKDIDKNYYVVYDTSKHKFEIHNSSQIGNSYCLTLPYTMLDERTLIYVRETSCENIEQILNKIESENELFENNEKRKALNNAHEMFEKDLYY